MESPFILGDMSKGRYQTYYIGAQDVPLTSGAELEMRELEEAPVWLNRVGAREGRTPLGR